MALDLPTPAWGVIAIIAGIAVWQGADLLSQSTEKISDHLGVPQAIRGGIIAAIATSFPEVVVSVFSVLLHGSINIGVGAIVGSAIFNILIIPGAIAVYVGKQETSRGLVYRDAVFYIVASLAFFLVLAFGVLNNQGTNSISQLTPGLSWTLIVLYGVYVFLLSLSKSSDENMEMHSKVDLPMQIGKLVAGLVVVAVGVEALIRSTQAISGAFGAPEFIVSIVVISALTSFPDLLVGVKIAERGNGEAAISNVFGSNTFNLMVALPLGVILAGGATVSFLEGVPLMVYLIAITTVVTVLVGTNLRLAPTEGYMMIALYVLFVTWMILEAVGVLNIMSTGQIPFV